MSIPADPLRAQLSEARAERDQARKERDAWVSSAAAGIDREVALSTQLLEARAELEATRNIAAALSEAQQRVERLEGHVRNLLGDLSDAERAISGWKFEGGMGANIAQEDRGRFPTLRSNAHRAHAEAVLSEEPAYLLPKGSLPTMKRLVKEANTKLDAEEPATGVEE